MTREGADLTECDGLRRQLAQMNELRRISTLVGSSLEPDEVMGRTLEGLGRLVEHDVGCVYLAEGGGALRRAARGNADRVPPQRVGLGDSPVGRVLADDEAVSSADRITLTVPLLASGSTVGACIHLRR